MKVYKTKKFITALLANAAVVVAFESILSSFGINISVSEIGIIQNLIINVLFLTLVQCVSNRFGIHIFDGF
ncbi:hypothetical protein [Lacrimispora amygdalina]|uniref:hypothetical protein n=1 Tax=Lacrimispora amygdalina TaxID=253257 RepID=UPI000BE3DF20|nr:hypothetical protein [Lacrimispora amygdalina]